MYFLLADVRSWEPVMPRSISGLVMQFMRVANVGRGGFRAEVTCKRPQIATQNTKYQKLIKKGMSNKT